MERDVSGSMRLLYGEELGVVDGVLHVVAVHGGDDGRWVMRIGEHSPKSTTDRFVLDLARARVEAIVVTGAILRDEPELRYVLPAALERHRRQVFGLSAPPWLLVLTRGDIPLDHPALKGWARPLIFTTEASAERLRARSELEIVGVAEPSARAALAHLRDVRGCRSISVEAGPKVAAPLYERPCAIDELALSVYTGSLDPRAKGGRFLDESDIERAFVRTGGYREGDWRFERWIVSPARRGTAGGSR